MDMRASTKPGFKSISKGASRIWRFFLRSTHRWMWQQLAVDGTVLEQSASGYAQYDDCVLNAMAHGYISAPSVSSKTAGSPLKARPVVSHSPAFARRNSPPIRSAGLVGVDDMPADDESGDAL